MDAKLRMNAIISMVKAWRLIFYQHALLAPALCQADGFTDDSPRSPWLGGRSVNWQFQYNVTNTNVHPENVLRRESMRSCLKGQREGCTVATLEWGFRQDQFTPCLQEDKVIQGKSRAGEDELRKLAAALLGSTCVLSSCSLLPFSQAVISQVSLVQEDIFFLLESLINFRSTCSESWQRCVSHLNKCLRFFFLYLYELFLKKLKLVGTQQGQFLWPVLKKWALQRSIVMGVAGPEDLAMLSLKGVGESSF